MNTPEPQFPVATAQKVLPLSENGNQNKPYSALEEMKCLFFVLGC